MNEGGDPDADFITIDKVLPAATNSGSRHLSEEHKHAFRTQMKSTSETISIGCWLVVVLSITSVVVLSVVVAVTAKVTSERKIILGTIVGSVLLIVQMILCIARREPNMLLIFSVIGAYLSGVALGLSIGYI